MSSEISSSAFSIPPAAERVHLTPGDPAPWFTQIASTNRRFTFDTVAGRYIVLCFYGSLKDDAGRAAIEHVFAHRRHFDDQRVCLFGVSLDSSDQSDERLREDRPGVRFFWDGDGLVSKLYGAVPRGWRLGDLAALRKFWMVLDPMLRVMRVFSLGPDSNAALFAYLEQLPPPDRFAGLETPAPVLVLPNVFEADFCRRLISVYEQQGGEESGVMREVNGRTYGVQDHTHKRRRDCVIREEGLIQQIKARIVRRVNPEIRKVYSFHVTRMERYLVGCYAARDGGHFRPHRDNTTKATAHRRFAISINLNADFEGGEVSFPEYGRRQFKAPPGGALIFPGSILHAVARVRRGMRYAFLPFVYDEEAARIREANRQFLISADPAAPADRATD